ncbi:hypothetical protein D3C87_1781020 [compost metagenome]
MLYPNFDEHRSLAVLLLPNEKNFLNPRRYHVYDERHLGKTQSALACLSQYSRIRILLSELAGWLDFSQPRSQDQSTYQSTL